MLSNVMFKKRAGVFYRSGFRPDKTRAASFVNGFKNIPGKACVNRVHNNYAFVMVRTTSDKQNPRTFQGEKLVFKDQCLFSISTFSFPFLHQKHSIQS